MPRFDLTRLDSLVSANPSRRYDSFSAFAENELQQVIAQTYDRKYPDLDATMHFPVATGKVNPGAQSWAFDSYEGRGRAVIKAPGAGDIPRADVSKGRQAYPVRSIFLAYGWDIEEMEAAAFAGVALDAKKGDACRRGIAELEHSIILDGDAGNGLPGVLSNPFVPIAAAPVGAWLGGTTTPEQMLADLNAMVTAPYETSKRVHNVSQILLPNAHYRRVQTTMMTASGVESVLSVFQKTNPGVSVAPMTELATAGPLGTPMALAYQKSPEIVESIIPLPFQQLPPDVKSTEVVVNCRERIGGAVWYYPAAAVKMTGI